MVRRLAGLRSDAATNRFLCDFYYPLVYTVPNADQVARRTNPMFVVLLKFSDNKDRAGQYMDGHKEWIKRGFDDGVFLLAGSLQPNSGGGIVAHNTSLAELQSRVNDDPFVAENVVSAEVLEITPSKAEERLRFLLD